MADDTVDPGRTGAESDPTGPRPLVRASTDSETGSAAGSASHRRWPIPRSLIGVVAVCLVILIAAATFAWTKAGARDNAQTTQDHAFQALRRERKATATAQRDLAGERHTISAFEQNAQAPLTSAETGIGLLNQLLADVQAIQAAGTNLGTPAAESAYNDVESRLVTLGGPLNAALNPLPGQVTALRAALLAATPN